MRAEERNDRCVPGLAMTETRPIPAAASMRRAAQYVRMSTERQRYSTANQMAAIARYADQHGLDIVSTYADEGRSGVSLGGRSALQRLIEDVTTERAPFSAILVYDVSRWGRFQDVDEAAFLEHMCKRAGISVHYCAEPFSNDGSMASSIVKTLKRAMAGEYSRELSIKVSAGQRRLCTLGFRQGGAPGFGLRRLLVDSEGRPKGELRQGELKSVQSDRVILVPGPLDEIATVHRIFRWFAEEGINERAIAGKLNEEGILTDLGRAWTFDTVRSLLTNEKYIGNNVYNRFSTRLGQRRRRNAPEQIIRRDGAFAPIVDRSVFAAAQRRFAQRLQRQSNGELLSQLTELRHRSGRLSGRLIDATPDMPPQSVIARRFGGLLRAYEQIGFSPNFSTEKLGARSLRQSLARSIADTLGKELRQRGGQIAYDPTRRLHVCNGTLTTHIYVAFPRVSGAGRLQWLVSLKREPMPDFTLVIRMNAKGQSIQDFLILPREPAEQAYLILQEHNGLPIDQFRHSTFKPFLALLEVETLGHLP